MVQMVIRVPKGFDAELFFNIASAIVRDNAENEYEAQYYDYDLGNLIKKRIYAGEDAVKNAGWDDAVVWYKPFYEPATDEYIVEAYYVDAAHIEAIEKLQKLCPQVETYFEAIGGKDKTDYYSNSLEYEGYLALVGRV